MADPAPDLSEVSYAAVSLDDGDLSPLALPKPPHPPIRHETAMDLAEAAEATADYSTLLTEDISTQTSFGRAAIRLETPKPAPVVVDEVDSGYAWNELPIVLSHYDLGSVKRIEAFKRGSRRAPKAVMLCDKGVFLLKRREATTETSQRILVAHRVQKHLLAARYPTPALLPTRRSGSTLVHLNEHLYEMFTFVRSEPFDRSADAAGAAGRALGLMHTILRDFPNPQDAPRGSFHQSPVVPRAFERAQETFSRVLSKASAGEGIANLNAIAKDLATIADVADDLGAKDGVERVCHGDWHPGNMLYNKERQVIGVVDYDSIRLQNPLFDLANGALQFSAVGGSDPSKWPDDLDVTRLQAFMRGYAQESGVKPATLRCIPWLMAEAMAVEVLLPVASRGAFAGIRGDLMMTVIRRKMKWLMSNAKLLHEAVEEALGVENAW